MLFRKFRQRHRIRNGRCPYCKADFILADIFDGYFYVPTKLCPNMCFAILFNLGTPVMDKMHINYQMMSNGGAPIPLPDEFIRLRSEILLDTEEA